MCPTDRLHHLWHIRVQPLPANMPPGSAVLSLRLVPAPRATWLDVAEARLSPGFATQSFSSAHTYRQRSRSRFLFGELSQPTSQGLRLKGHSGKGVPRLCSPAPWLALPVLTVVAPTELYAQPLLCPFILYTPTEQKRGASGFLHISLPEQHVLGLDWPYPTTLSGSSPDPPSLSPQNLLREAAEST